MASDSASNPIFHRPAPHLVVRGFFGAAEVARLLDYARAREGDFEVSGVTGAKEGRRIDSAARISRRLTPVPELLPLVRGRLDSVFPEVIRALGCGAFQESAMEVELVAHNHGAFFARHVDTITGDVPGKIAGDEACSGRASRMVSMVYYFSATPPQFTGGILRLHSLAATGAPGTYVDITPENDTALFFPSWFPHEVLPVTCESREFMDSRFAINCWAYK